MVFSIIPLFQLTKQFDRAGVVPISKRGHSTDSKDRHRAQELSELACCPWIEAAIGTAGQTHDLPKHLLDFTVMTFLEHERSYPEASKLACFVRGTALLRSGSRTKSPCLLGFANLHGQ